MKRKEQCNSDDRGNPEGSIDFTIDGVEYSSTDRRQTAAQLLTLAAVDPADHDLARILGQGQVEKRFEDNDEVQLTPGARFVSIFTGPTPVV
jgi:hypothetical protein